MKHVSFGRFHFQRALLLQTVQGFTLKTGTKRFVSLHKASLLETQRSCTLLDVWGIAPRRWRVHRDSKNFYYSQNVINCFLFWPTSGPRSSTLYLKSHSLFDFLLFFCIIQPKSSKALWKSSSSVEAIKAQPFRRSSVALMDFFCERWKALVVLLHLHSLSFAASVLFSFLFIFWSVISAVCTSAQTVEKPHKTEMFSSFKNQGLWRAFCLKPVILTRVNPSFVDHARRHTTVFTSHFTHAFVSFVSWLCLCCFGAKK